MNGKKDISKLNLRVTIKQWDTTQDEAGGTTYNEIQSWDVWANKRNRTGSQSNTEAQQQWGYDTVFMIRYNPLYKSNFTVDHVSQRWIINSIEIDNEAYKGMMLLQCSTTDINIDVS